jgi:hypothetical protein
MLRFFSKIIVSIRAFDDDTVVLITWSPIQLRREVAQLRAARQDTTVGPADSSKTGDSAVNEQLKTARIEIARLEAEKQEIIAQANTQKEKLAKVQLPSAIHMFATVLIAPFHRQEVKQLRQDLERVNPGATAGGAQASGPYKQDSETQGPSREVSVR